MANVYRKGTKSVHRSILDGWNGRARFDVLECNLDFGGVWGPSIPVGARCELCFGERSVASRSGRSFRPGRKAVTAGSAASLVLVAAVLAGQSGAGPVSSPTFSASPVLVTPGPSGPVRTPMETPVVTAAPSTPAVTPPPLPVETGAAPALPTWPPVPTWPPLPPTPTARAPQPTQRVCVHPGKHNGVEDPCKWPRNP